MFHRFRYAIVALARASTASRLFPISASQNAINARTRVRARNDPRSQSTCHVPVPSGGHRSQQRRHLRRGAIRDVCSRVIGLQISGHGVGTKFERRPQHQTRPCGPAYMPELPLFSESRHCLKALASDLSTNNGTSRSQSQQRVASSTRQRLLVSARYIALGASCI